MISLVGMPGGGKSTVGRHLARRLGVAFADCDAVIAQRIGCPIRVYFEHEGEARFRDLEAQVLAERVADGDGVLATGGGVVLRPENRALLRSASVCVYLRSTPEELYRRLRHDVKRPLLQVVDPLARLRELHSERDPLYLQTAEFVVETGRPSVPSLVHMIVMQLELAGRLPARVPGAGGAVDRGSGRNG